MTHTKRKLWLLKTILYGLLLLFSFNIKTFFRFKKKKKKIHYQIQVVLKNGKKNRKQDTK